VRTCSQLSEPTSDRLGLGGVPVTIDLPARPRWGTFSVIDHLDPAALTTEVLL